MTEKQADQQQTTEASASQGATTSGVVALTQGRGGIIGIKAGMTQVYNENGDSIAVTVIDLKPCTITQVKTMEKNGYQAIQVGILERKVSKVRKPDAGHAKASGKPGFYHMEEFRLSDTAKLDGLTVGKVLSPEFVKPGDMVDIIAMSKGKGFQGGMKRFHMAGGNKTHGASVSHRQLGSIGNRADPGRVFKGKKMPGHMGHVRSTVQNVMVVKVDAENQFLLVHGSVPGPRSGIVTVMKAAKNKKGKK
jgi:large subunit ribosomal protein L3